MNEMYFDNPLSLYLKVFGVIVFVLLIRKILSRVLANILYRLVAKAGKNIPKKKFVDLVIQPLKSFLLLFAIIVCFEKLTYPGVLNFNIYHITFKQLIESVSLMILISTFIWLCLRVLEFISLILIEKANLTQEQTDNQLIVFFKDFFKVLLVIAGILLIWRFAFNQHLGGVLTSVSIVGAAIALAFRESLENLIASFVIFFDRPFTTGDIVKVQSVTGSIERIGLRSTRIRTDQKTYVSVPNKQMVDSIVDNQTNRTQRRGSLHLDVHPATRHAQVDQLLNQIKSILSNHAEVETQQVWLEDVRKTGIVLTVDFYTHVMEAEDFLELKQKINLEILAAMQSMQIQMAPLG
jgi:MscS family membrane protein